MRYKLFVTLGVGSEWGVECGERVEEELKKLEFFSKCAGSDFGFFQSNNFFGIVIVIFYFFFK